MAQHRSPREARVWAKQTFGREIGETKNKSGIGKVATEQRTQKQNPTFDSHKRPTIVVQSETEEDSEGDEVFKDMQRLSGLRRTPAPSRISSATHRQVSSGSSRQFSAERRDSLLTQKRKFQSIDEPRKRSLLDEQPDARRISFDSQSRPSTPQQAIAPIELVRRRLTPQRPPGLEDDDEFEEPINRSVDPELLQRSRTSAAARRPEYREPIPEDMYESPTKIANEAILDRIHGPARTQSAYPTAQPIRKGRGFEWTSEQEKFLISQIQVYGTAWADIARKYCKPGEILQGRDQVKLKDKARNIKEKYLRYVSPITCNSSSHLL
jgi:hypothetical protein